MEYFDYPSVPLDFKHQPSMRVSLNPQFLYYDPVNDSGINVGLNNREQTVGGGNTFRMELKEGASCPGDYLYRSGSLKWDVESGM